jgi:hypothetical protein
MRLGILVRGSRHSSVLIVNANTPATDGPVFGKVGMNIAQNVNRETPEKSTHKYIYCGRDDRTHDRAIVRLPAAALWRPPAQRPKSR